MRSWFWALITLVLVFSAAATLVSWLAGGDQTAVWIGGGVGVIAYLGFWRWRWRRGIEKRVDWHREQVEHEARSHRWRDGV